MCCKVYANTKWVHLSAQFTFHKLSFDILSEIKQNKPSMLAAEFVQCVGWLPFILQGESAEHPQLTLLFVVSRLVPGSGALQADRQVMLSAFSSSQGKTLTLVLFSLDCSYIAALYEINFHIIYVILFLERKSSVDQNLSWTFCSNLLCMLSLSVGRAVSPPSYNTARCMLLHWLAHICSAASNSTHNKTWPDGTGQGHSQVC